MINRSQTLSNQHVFVYTGNEKLFANKDDGVQKVNKKQMNSVEVLVDLLGYGTVELTVDYSLHFLDGRSAGCSVECHISLIEEALHGWLYSPDFKLLFSELGGGKGHMVSFSGEGINKNVYYQTMLNVVSDYIFLKEKFFL